MIMDVFKIEDILSICLQKKQRLTQNKVIKKNVGLVVLRPLFETQK